MGKIFLAKINVIIFMIVKILRFLNLEFAVIQVNFVK